MTRTLLRHSPLTSSQQIDTLLNQAGVRGRLPWKALQLCHTAQHRKRVRSRKHAVRARRLQRARLDKPLPGPASDAGRVFTVWDRRVSARRRPGARPRDSKDRSKVLSAAPTRLPRIVTLASDTPHASRCRQAPKHPAIDLSRRRHRSPANGPRPQGSSEAEYCQTPTCGWARYSPACLKRPTGARHFLALESGTGAMPTVPGPGVPPTSPVPLPANSLQRRFCRKAKSEQDLHPHRSRSTMSAAARHTAQ
ncbi:hypothetical protein AIF0345_2732 [Actinomyces israelii]|nr:hypothetical protein AIF0345_2732 [Actinomyces israelii]